MKQIIQSYKTGKLSVVEVPTPNVNSGRILVETKASLISSGTERMLVDLAKKNLLQKAKERPDLVAKVIEKGKREGFLTAFEAAFQKLENPIPLGYSMAGVVLESGKNIDEFVKGDRVACAGAGIANHAELNLVPKNLAVRIPDKVSDEEACFVTVASIALQGVRLVNPTLGENVMVIGLGLIGQIAASLLTAHGCNVIAVDIDPSKVKLAMVRGAIAGAITGQEDVLEIVKAHTRGKGADSIVITASSQTNEPLILAGEAARERARISVVGMLPMEFPRNTFYMKELDIVVSRSYGPGRYDPNYEERGQDYPIGYVRWTERRNMEAVLSCIEKGQLDVKSLITHYYSFEKVLEAYDLITGKIKEPHLGVVLTYENLSKDSSSAAGNTKKAGYGQSGSKKELGVALVGTGAFATGMLLPKILSCSNVKLKAVVSGKGLSAKHVADRFSIPWVASSLDEVLANKDVDCVVISTRHEMHSEQAARSLLAGKDVFLEKPAAISELQLEQLQEAFIRSGKKLMIGFNRRFAPFSKEVVHVFAKRKAGLVMNARINAGQIPSGSWVTEPSEGGGRVIGEVCHFIDLMSYWAGDSQVTHVSAHALSKWGGYERSDNLVIDLSFQDGSVGNILYTSMGDPSSGKERFEIFGEGKTFCIEDWRKRSISIKGKTDISRSLRADKGHSEELKAFFASCLAGDPSPIPWESLASTTRVTFAIEEAWRNGCMVEM